ncbi:peptidoglycan-binding protein [Hartmannibacter diazotrophicus]|nr:peptidoglycan-binding protein [Hartmannibacter diazotrophicus]
MRMGDDLSGQGGGRHFGSAQAAPAEDDRSVGRIINSLDRLGERIRKLSSATQGSGPQPGEERAPLVSDRPPLSRSQQQIEERRKALERAVAARRVRRAELEGRPVEHADAGSVPASPLAARHPHSDNSAVEASSAEAFRLAPEPVQPEAVPPARAAEPSPVARKLAELQRIAEAMGASVPPEAPSKAVEPHPHMVEPEAFEFQTPEPRISEPRISEPMPSSLAGFERGGNLDARLERMEQSLPDREQIAGIREEILRLRDAVASNAVTPAIAPLTRSYDALVERLDMLGQRLDEPGPLAQLIDTMSETRALIGTLPTRRAMEEIADQLDGLAHGLQKSGASAFDPASLEQQIAEVTSRLDTLDVTRQVAMIEQRLDGVAERIEGIEVQFGKLDVLPRLEQTLIDQGRILDEKLESGLSRIPALEEDVLAAREDVQSGIGALAERIDEVSARLAGLGVDSLNPEMLAALERRMDDIAGHLEALQSGGGEGALAAIDERLTEIGSALDARIAGMQEATTDAVAALARRIDARETVVDPSVTRQINELTDKIDELVKTPASAMPALDMVEVRLDEIVARIGAIETSTGELAATGIPSDGTPGPTTAAIARIEEMIGAIASADHLEAMERQIAELASALDKLEALPPQQAADLERQILDLRHEITDVSSAILETVRGEISGLSERLGDVLETAQGGMPQRDLDGPISHLIDRIDAQARDNAGLVETLSRIEAMIPALGSGGSAAAVDIDQIEAAQSEIASVLRDFGKDLVALREEFASSRNRDLDLLESVYETLCVMSENLLAPGAKTVAAGLARESETDRETATGASWKDIERSLNASLGALDQDMPSGSATAGSRQDDRQALDAVSELNASESILDDLVAQRGRAEPEEPLALDETMAEEVESDLPLEPGSGKPETPMRRPAGGAPRPGSRPTAEAPAAKAGAAPADRPVAETDYIAAARRAASRAASEQASVKIEPDDARPVETRKAKEAGSRGGLASLLLRNKRQLMLAATALILTIGAVQVIGWTLKPAPKPAPVAQTSSGLPEKAVKTTAVPTSEQALASPDEEAPVFGDISKQLPANGFVQPKTEGMAATTAEPAVKAEDMTAADGAATPASEPVQTADSAEAPVAVPVVPAVPEASPAAGTDMQAAAPDTQVAAAGPDMAATGTDMETADPDMETTGPDMTTASADPVASTVRVAPMPPEDIGSLALREAAASGDPKAEFEVAARFVEGRGVTQDLKAAADWYRRAAEQGLPAAQYRLGSFYENGSGIARDFKEAAKWYEQAADKGNAKAMHNLAVLLSDGSLGKPDYAKAADWFTKAANFGVRDSQYNLGILHARGFGVSVDMAESYKWFALAANAGDTEAAKKRDDVARALSPDALARARLAVDTWQAEPLDPDANDVSIDNPAWMEMPNPVAVTAGGAELVQQVQSLLGQQGFNPGPADGVMGARTRDAIKAFQKSRGLPETGEADAALLQQLSQRSI